MVKYISVSLRTVAAYGDNGGDLAVAVAVRDGGKCDVISDNGGWTRDTDRKL